MAPVAPQPLIAVTDVELSSAWYQQVLGVASGHGGAEYEQLTCDGELVLQLHKLEEAHHHEPIGVTGAALGNGVALWFRLFDFDAAVDRIRDAEVHVVTDAHVNPNAGHREMWVRDPDSYLVVIASEGIK